MLTPMQTIVAFEAEGGKSVEGFFDFCDKLLRDGKLTPKTFWHCIRHVQDEGDCPWL